MGVKVDYLESAVEAICHSNPGLDREQVAEIVRKELKKRLRDPSILIDNNVTGHQQRTTLTELCNYLDNEKPVVAGNSTFYVQPTVLKSPTSNMILSLKALRKSIKKAMFGEEDPDEYAMKDLKQGNTKVAMNAEYGASGAPTAAFYTKYSPAATTLMAQAIITTMAAFFEGFIGDNMKFFSINEFVDWAMTIRRTKKKMEIHDWIIVPTADDVYKRICRHFVELNMADLGFLKRFCDNLKKKDLVYIYYANNLNEFLKRHRKPCEALERILTKLPNYEASETIPPQFADKFKSVKDYNGFVAKEMFLDPYSIPDRVKEDVNTFKEFCMHYCFVDYLTPDSIMKLNNHKRNTIILVDTDSNVINANMFISFVANHVLNGASFGRSNEYNEMILANSLAAVLAEGAERILETYGKSRNADAEARKELTMKNEYYFRRLFLMPTKKRYACSVILREGNIMIPYHTEIKGLDFIKAGVSDDVTERFTKILQDNVLFAETPQLQNLMRDLRIFEKEIHDDLQSGNVRYLKTLNYKVDNAYKNKWGQQVYKAVDAWNSIVPENKISSFSKVKLAKLNVNTVDDLKIIKESFPRQYDMAVKNIFKSYDQDRQKSGLKAIAIPLTVGKIPDWIIPLLDYQSSVSDVCSSFKSVLDSFKTETIPVKTATGQARINSGLIAI